MTGNLVFQYMGRCINCKDILATLTVINPAPNRTQEGILKNDKFASQPDFKSHVDQVCGENMELFNPGEYAAVLVEFKLTLHLFGEGSFPRNYEQEGGLSPCGKPWTRGQGQGEQLF